MSILRTVLLPAVALAPMAAMADISWYMGAGAGGTRVEEDIDVDFTAFEYDSNGVLTPIASASVDKYEGTDVGFRVFGGIRIGRFFGIEAGYVDLGEPEDQIPLNIPQFPPPPTAFQRPETDVELVLTDEIDGWEIFALGAFPLSERWEAFAKLGVIAWDNDFKTQNAFADQYPPSPPDASFPAVPTLTPLSSTVSDDGTDMAGGIGFNYQATERMILRGEGTWYDIDDTERVWLLGFNVIVSY